MMKSDTRQDTRKRDLVMCVSAFLGVFSVLGLILRLVTGMYQSNVAVLMVLSLGVCSWSFVAVRLGQSTTYSASILLGFWGLILLLTGGSSTGSISPAVMLLTVIPLLATMMINRSAGLIALALILASLPILMSGTPLTFAVSLGPATPENLMLLRGLDLVINTSLLGWALWRYASIPTAMPDLVDQHVTHDFLTGLGNRRAVDKALADATILASDNSEWLSIILLDVDEFAHFKQRFGEHSGDRCLVQIASILEASSAQPRRYLGRYRDQEFALILPGTDPRQAVACAEHLRETVSGSDIVLENSSLQKVTITLGAASIRTDRQINPIELINMARQRLQSAKKAGGNQVQSAQLRDSKPSEPIIVATRERVEHPRTLVAAR